MDDMNAFDRQLANVVLRRVGPSEPVDDVAVFDAVIAANRRKGWGFDMFSALKFVAAAAIVALFGGFLLAGILTTQQGDDVLPAAVTESPSPMTTEELLSGMVTEEIEPGVLRVVNDGVRDLPVTLDADGDAFAPTEAIRVSPDGVLWVFGGHWDDAVFRLGEAEGYPWPEGTPLDLLDLVGRTDDVEVAPDGTATGLSARH